MTHSYGPPSVRQIRAALEEVDGALRYEPLPEDAGVGTDPATEFVIWEPGAGPQSRETIELEQERVSESGDVVADEPAVIFELPPSVTDAEVRRALGEERIGELKRLTEVRGVDALGWYVTFHQNRFQHGVHVPVESLVWMAVTTFRDLKLPLKRRIDLAFHAILRHELFHFSADCMIANWELASGVEVYWTSRSTFRNKIGYIELEEALANAYMLRGFKHPTRRLANSAGAFSALTQFCRLQPAGYDDGPKYAKARADYLVRSADLAHEYHRASVAKWRAPDEFDALVMYPDLIRIDWTRCPIILQDQFDLQALLGLDISLFRTVEGIDETSGFRRSLDKLDKRLQNQWAKRKLQLAQSTSLSSLDFKQWKPGGQDVYSVRIDGNFRAHLRYDRTQTVWFAEEIGNHKDMKHG